MPLVEAQGLGQPSPRMPAAQACGAHVLPKADNTQRGKPETRSLMDWRERLVGRVRSRHPCQLRPALRSLQQGQARIARWGWSMGSLYQTQATIGLGTPPQLTLPFLSCRPGRSLAVDRARDCWQGKIKGTCQQSQYFAAPTAGLRPGLPCNPTPGLLLQAYKTVRPRHTPGH